jgi:hypothetical protein
LIEREMVEREMVKRGLPRVVYESQLGDRSQAAGAACLRKRNSVQDSPDHTDSQRHREPSLEDKEQRHCQK